MSRTDQRWNLEQLLARRSLTELQARLIGCGRGNQLLVGSYVINDLLGTGLFGDSYLASDVQNREVVNLRLFNSSFSRADGLYLKRVIRNQKSPDPTPGIQRAIKTGLHNGKLYLVSEFVTGENLANVIARTGPLSIPVALKIAADIIETKLKANTIGAFGSLRPSKVILDVDRNTVIRDLYWSRCPELLNKRHGIILEIRNWPLDHIVYTAPHVLSGRPVPLESADVYATGTLLQLMIHGRAPYDLATAESLISQKFLSDQMESVNGLATYEEIKELIRQMVQCDGYFYNQGLIALQSELTKLRSDPRLVDFESSWPVRTTSAQTSHPERGDPGSAFTRLDDGQSGTVSPPILGTRNIR